jgi:hypothetical protein
MKRKKAQTESSSHPILRLHFSCAGFTAKRRLPAHKFAQVFPIPLSYVGHGGKVRCETERLTNDEEEVFL